MFFGLGIIGVLSSYLSTTFITLQRRRERSVIGEQEQDEGNAEVEEHQERDEDLTTTDLVAKLTAIQEELEVLRKLFEERYRTQ